MNTPNWTPDWWRRLFGAAEPPHIQVLRVFLADPDRPRFGYDLMQTTRFPSGRLYPALARLKRDAWITGTWEDINEDEAGRPARRSYRLTAAGRVHARALVDARDAAAAAPDQRPTLEAARNRADALMGRPGPDADGYADAFTDTAREVLAALLYAAAVTEADPEQVRRWASTYSLEPYELLRARTSGEAEDPDARTACIELLRVYQQMPDRSRSAVMMQVAAALDNLKN
ncbi:PadR family transcriptional regulator [Nocardiopsis changdeensis]|uniref:Helix-turn-helix transcriptional regulator n=1 Tax=Nocardiopsis changdeensis TaxID=2831969 RepID=A0A975KSZ2_9ACTN|nr:MULTISPECIES: PadR family transcriptional regulator [Nocardiopsis]QUX26405.1 helix-turn-helix transcriptional regulator [Nocardiopsis changdeensis]QYX40677.1 PadR family transcriptional regulator [Nocardiopsis sp. MT53]